jgi:phospholipase C
LNQPEKTKALIALAALAAGLGGAACSASQSALGPGSCDPELRFGPASIGLEPNDDFLAQRAAPTCHFKTGSTTAESLGPDVPSAAAVGHVVVLMMENRSFDHYLSDLPAVGVTDASVAPADAANPDATGGQVTRFPARSYCIANEVRHEWSDAHLQLNNGQMNGFVAASTDNAMAYYDHTDLPVLYALASQFTVSDRHFAALPGPTWPNRLFFFAGTSCDFAEGSDTNPNITLKCGLVANDILREMSAQGDTFKIYDESGPANVATGLGLGGIPDSFAHFTQDVQAGSLPQVSFVGASTGSLPSPLGPTEDDDHPAANVLLGEAFIYQVVQTLASNPAVWQNTVLFITYDEHGGFYDHVQPPAACDPTEGTMIRDYAFDQYGFRVPLVIVSPFAKRGYVSHADTDHTSITRFIEHWLGLGALTVRDANAWPFLDAFDFDHPVLDVPQLSAPVAVTGSVTCARTP